MDKLDFIKIFESKEVEFKESLNSPSTESRGKTFAGFANTNGGSVFVGVKDNGKFNPLNKKEVDETILKVDTLIEQKITPRISYKPIIHEINNSKQYIIEFKVNKIDNEVYWYKKDGEIYVVYLRRANRTTVASPSEITNLILKLNKIDFEKHKTNILFDINKFKTLKEELKKHKKDKLFFSKEELLNRRLINEDLYINNGLYLFMDDSSFPNLNISLKKYDGLNKESEIREFRYYASNLLISYFDSLEFISIYNKKINERFSYPLKAIEEALKNSLIHRDYSIYGAEISIDIYLDRIEITSPGSFLFDRDAQEYDISLIPTKKRNENVSYIFSLLFNNENELSGLKEIKNEYKIYNEKYEPKIYSNGDYFKITLFNLNYEKSLENKEKFIYKEITEGTRKYDKLIFSFCFNKKRKAKEIQDFIKIKDYSYFYKRILSPLIKEKYLLSTEKNKKSPNQKYYLNIKKVKNIASFDDN